jgi:hypothetical protein
VAVIFYATALAQATAYQQLVGINQQWQNQTSINPTLKTQAAQPLAEQQLIQFHLQETETLLRSKNTLNLTKAQQLQRNKLLDILHNYCVAGKFPQNTQHQNRQPYFIDDFNTYCAVGYLMQQSGAGVMAKEINATQNYNYLADITHPQLMSWVQQSGFSIDELALIQPGYGGDHPAYISEIHYNNIGTDVNEYIEVLNSNGGLIGLINFDSIFFYNSIGNIYKKISFNQMVTNLPPVGNNKSFSYYNFTGGSDTLADIGKIELTHQSNLLYQFIYNKDSIVAKKLYSNGSSDETSTFYTVENDNTPIAQSLNFCGFAGWGSNLNISIASTTIATLNSCVVTPVTLSHFTSNVKDHTIH